MNGANAIRGGVQNDRRIAAAAIVVMTALLMSPALASPPMLHDSFWIDVVWTDQFAAELGSGNPYPRWLPDSHGGLGSPVFYYYPPLAFYLSGAFQLLGLSPYGAVLATFAAAFALAGAGAYLWLGQRTASPLLGALLFMAAPYHALDFIWRGAQGESLAIAILPILAIGLRRIAEGRGGTLAAISYAALIMSHLPLALLTSLFFIVPYMLYHRVHLAHFSLAAALGLGLAAIYLGPALSLDPWRESARLYAMDMLRPSYWTMWSGNGSDSAVRSIWFLEAVLALALAAAWALGRCRWALVGLAVIALAAGILPGLWQLPLLEKVQFPYRALPIAELALAGAIARLDWRRALGIALIPLALTATFHRAPTQSARTLADFLEAHRDVAEYLPPGANRGGSDFPTPDELGVRARLPPQHPGWKVEPTFYFPAWTCAVAEPRTKLVMHRPGCTPRLERLWIERTMAALSALSLLILAALSFTAWRRRASS